MDFVVSKGNILIAIEVKSGRKAVSLPGMDAFAKTFPVRKKLLIGDQGLPWQEFLLIPPDQWLR